MSGSPIGSLGYTLPNEAWGAPSGAVNWYNATFNYSAKHGYSEWKDDYIWLPSLTETGYGMSDYGLWQLSDSQRSNTTYTWLRSGGSGVADGSKFVSKKMFAICMSGVAALITVCVLLVCVVIHLARRIPKRSNSAGEEESD